LAAAAPLAAATAIYSCIGTGNTASTGNISVDPLFADAADGDFHLKSQRGRLQGSRWVRDAQTSPCINAGDPAGDFSAEPMPNGGRVNMGAFGSTNQASMSGNTAPAVTSVSISPNPAYTNNDLTAVPSGWNDPDGDPAGYDYQWAWWDGGSWQNFVGATTDTLASGHFVKGDQLRVTCWPNDGGAQGTPVTAEATIQNSQPPQPTVAISPASPTTNDSLTAGVHSGPDADGDTVTFSYQWYKDGLLQPDRKWATVAAKWTSPSEEWLCAVTPNDGTDDGTPGEDAVTH